MHEQQTRLTTDAGQLAEKLPAAFAVFHRFRAAAESEDRPFGSGVKAFGIEQGTLIVIAEDDEVATHHPVNALARVRAVTTMSPRQ